MPWALRNFGRDGGNNKHPGIPNGNWAPDRAQAQNRQLPPHNYAGEKPGRSRTNVT
jgi:hypothetical protein